MSGGLAKRDLMLLLFLDLRVHKEIIRVFLFV
jgi:hypothetical protein